MDLFELRELNKFMHENINHWYKRYTTLNNEITGNYENKNEDIPGLQDIQEKEESDSKDVLAHGIMCSSFYFAFYGKEV